MKPVHCRNPTILLTTVLLAQLSLAQTYTSCNPLQQTCPANPALSGTSNVNFLSGESAEYKGTGNGISYSSDGAQLSVGQSGDNPTLTSNWYIMFGRVDFVFKSAPGVGMVSSAILISDDLDEIDWELLGADSSQAQTNYFSKGVTGSYNRGGYSSILTSQSDFNTYSIDWTAEQITWQINGNTVRTLTYDEAAGQYPQTPMQVKVGSWAGGDATNAPGTIEWAGGPIDYSNGPYTMQVQSVSATDYSTGTEYRYDGTSGTWQSIVAVGGSINGEGPSESPPTPIQSQPATATDGSQQTTAPPTSSYLASLGFDETSTTRQSSPSSGVLSPSVTFGDHPEHTQTGITTTTRLPASSTDPVQNPATTTTSLPPFDPNSASRISGTFTSCIAPLAIFIGVLAFIL